MKREHAAKIVEEAFAKYVRGQITREAMLDAMDAFEATKPAHKR